MSTNDSNRIAEIRSRRQYLNALGCGETEQAQDTVFLLAEVDRLTRELAAVTEERDDALSLIDRMESDDISDNRALLHTQLVLLREAHTWTPATPETMPPVSDGAVGECWLVEMPHPDSNVWGCPLTTINRYWVLEKRDGRRVWFREGELFPIENTRFAAVPAEPVEETTT